MEGLVAILMPVLIVFIVTYFRFRTKQLALEEKRGYDPKLLEAADKEKKLLEARVQNLESIVCSVDFELNQRLNRLTAVSQSMRALPAAGGAQPDAAFEATIASQPGGYVLGHLEPGRVVLERYRVVHELGRGGMGAVYLAEDSRLGERVALK